MTIAANITSPVTLKPIAGRILAVNVMAAGTAAGSINDCNSIGAAAAANAYLPLPMTVGTISIAAPIVFGTGITVSPGTGQTITVEWE